MATTYTCDKCGHVLTSTNAVPGGAHRLKITDTIPWGDTLNRNPNALNTTLDLCDACLLDFKCWARTHNGGNDA